MLYFSPYILPFLFFFMANGDASLGKYSGGVTGAAADEGLFIKDHAY